MFVIICPFSVFEVDLSFYVFQNAGSQHIQISLSPSLSLSNTDWIAGRRLSNFLNFNQKTKQVNTVMTF